jgi:hypothetical protein
MLHWRAFMPCLNSVSATRVRHSGAVIAAALALPGVWAPPASAQTATERPQTAVLWLSAMHYEESQPGLERVTVTTPSARLLMPLASHWALEGGLVADSVSGASPRWQSAVSSASVMREKRRAGDVKLTRYYEHSAYSIGLAHSTETDYSSSALSLGANWASPDKNTTWSVSVAGTGDVIKPGVGSVASIAEDKRDGTELLVGVTQALSRADVIQLNLTLNAGEGYYNDPYKLFDERPRARKQAALLGRWNHHLAADRSTARASYRYYKDSYGVDAHTVQAEWVKPLTDRLSLTPSVRYSSQRAARFYTPAVVDAAGLPVYPAIVAGEFVSGDQRLAAFGALSLGLRVEFKLNDSLSLDTRLERYEQRADWRLGGQGSSGLAPLRVLTLHASRAP